MGGRGKKKFKEIGNETTGRAPICMVKILSIIDLVFYIGNYMYITCMSNPHTQVSMIKIPDTRTWELPGHILARASYPTEIPLTKKNPTNNFFGRKITVSSAPTDTQLWHPHKPP